MSGDTATEPNLIGVVDAVAFRDAVLLERQKVMGLKRPLMLKRGRSPTPSY